MNKLFVFSTCIILLLITSCNTAQTHQEVIRNLVDSPYNYSLHLDQPPQAVTITNIGSVAIRNPWIVVNDSHNWTTIDAILAEIITPAMSDQQKALAIWQFMVDNRYHFDPAESTFETHDPVKYLNIYGYGYCDDSARVISALWRSAGLETRIWELDGHVVSEVKYGGDYHIMDADLEVYYPMPDGRLAGLEDIQQDYSLVAQVDHHGLVESDYLAYEIYPGDVILEDAAQITDHRMEMVLRPGESFQWRWDNIGKYHQNFLGTTPPLYANGKFIYSPDLKDDQFLEYLDGQQDVIMDHKFNYPRLHLTPDTPDGHIIIKVESPYVIVGATLQAEFVRPSTEDTINVFASNTNGQWEKITSPDNLGVFNAAISLDQWIAPLSSGAKYHYYLMIEFIPGAENSRAGMNTLNLVTDVQISPFSLPAFAVGENTVSYFHNTQKPHSIKIALQ